MLSREKFDAVLLNSQHNFAWLTGGGCNGVDLSRENGIAALMVNRQADTWTPQITTDYANATITAFCGQPPSPAAARSLAATMRTLLQHAG